MGNLIIHEDDGWEELEGDVDEFKDLWDAVAVGDVAKAVKALEDSGWEFEEWHRGTPIDVRVILVPDSMLGQRERVWVRWAPGPKDWSPKRRRK